VVPGMLKKARRGSDETELRKDELRKDELRKDELRKDELRKDELRKDELRKDELRKDELRKDELRKIAEARLEEQQSDRRKRAGGRRADERRPKTAAARSGLPTNRDAQRMVHELQVHQIELEMQNAELRRTRRDVEAALEKYTDLYDFAPVGFFSIDEVGLIQDANLTGAGLLGIERSRLINRRLQSFVAADSRSTWVAFLKRVFSSTEKQVCEVLLLSNQRDAPFWAALQATAADATEDELRWCRVALEDIGARKHAEEAQRRIEILAVTNQELKSEILRRQSVEAAFKNSEQNQAQLLVQSRHLQEQLRRLSHQVLDAQEEERKRISRELHDDIAQTLTAILVHLMVLKPQASANPKALGSKDVKRTVARIEGLVRNSVNIVRRFARALRPALLDLGLSPALQSFIKEFVARTKLEVELTASAGLEELNGTQRTALYRVVQQALVNVAQHAHARRVTVRISRVGDSVDAAIHDDGKSFDVERALSVTRRNARLGLIGMRERVEMLGGIFSVESVPGRGTTVSARVPLGVGDGSSPRAARRLPARRLRR
jgi:pentapeptide MXKDX repeat protein